MIHQKFAVRRAEWLQRNKIPVNKTTDDSSLHYSTCFSYLL